MTTLLTTTVVVLAVLAMLCMLTSLVSSVVILVTLLHPTTLTWTMGTTGHTSAQPSGTQAPTTQTPGVVYLTPERERDMEARINDNDSL